MVEEKQNTEVKPVKAPEQPVKEKAPEQKPQASPKPVVDKVSKPEQKPQASFRHVKDNVSEHDRKLQSNFRHIVRIAHVDLAGDKPIKISLKKIKGVGFNLAGAVCNLAGIWKGKKTGELTDSEIKKLDSVLTNPKENGIPVWMFNRRKDYETGEDKHLLMGTLDFVKDNTLKRLKKIKCYKGTRHSKGLPARGQRTKANFRRSKGKVVGVAKKKGAKSSKP
jgi:small subunit ribosomal protein S13